MILSANNDPVRDIEGGEALPCALFIAPIMPQQTGNGLAMRAGMTLRALSQYYRVYLVVVPVAGSLQDSSDFARQFATALKVLDPQAHLDPLAGLILRVTDEAERARARAAYPKVWLSRLCTSATAHAIMAWADGVPFAVLHVMRLYLATLAEPFLRRVADRPLCGLDLDDDDADVYDAMAEGSGQAAMLRAEAEKFRALATRMLPQFDRRFVSAARDAERLAANYPGNSFDVVPNGYPLIGQQIARRSNGGDGLRLLFIGGLGYPPNADAVAWLCGPVLSALRAMGGEEVMIDIVGAGADRLTRTDDPAIVVHGYVEDVTALYASADIAVVPIRIGGGTRIKILEAFHYTVPVVSTHIGAAGLEVQDGRHLLLADDPANFAAACLRLKRDNRLAIALTTNAAKLVAESYGPEAVADILFSAYNNQ